ncbi:cytosolic carboxypeptidase 3 isoform X2 [Rhinatrema bivittatum]|uniref:cytosolic carboxypeptidase 3 isoform X2 n=1 Tax=Rhinatrema bivittatum TaxID=194408 RepID=UPI00112DB371|nr:cytosolic carboxypeptidase 3 isoform X2 [Rhinatrema bivittatum]
MIMSEDSDKEDQQSNHTSSDDSESDTDFYIPFVPASPRRSPFYTVSSIYNGHFQRTTQIVFEHHLGRQIPRLREPRDLYGVSSAGSLPRPRWPYECEVIKEKIWHIEWHPLVPESLYSSTGLEEEAVHSEGRVVYIVNEGNKESCFTFSRVGGNHSSLKQVAIELLNERDTTLIFESRFESGNLQKVVQVGEYEYELTLRTDLYTDKHTQWYYFRVQNTRVGIPYRFTIVNFHKPASLYNLGMRPLIYSEQEARISQIGWHRIGTDIKYYKNNLGCEGKHYYSLSWTFQFPHHRDTCYFAHCYPYTYSNLQRYLVNIANDHERSRFCKVRILCRSLAGNLVYILTITNPSPSAKVMRHKKAVILTARVHPGETNSSWMMKGFLDFILSNRQDAQLLRDMFIFKVVPMLNPDGVIVGNYRCSLTGRDLNRNYRSILKDSFPIVYCTRNMIKRVMEEWEVLLYCDLHGHSRKQNVFMYGCSNREGEGGQMQSSYLEGRVFPLMLSKNDPNKFSFSGCKFRVHRSKEGTGRVVMWKMGINNSYTIESSFCGSTLGNRQGTHFSTKDLESLGYDFCDTLLDFCDPDQSKYYYCLKELEDMMKEQATISLYDSEISLMDVASDLESSTGGSDSSDSNGLPAHLMAFTCKRPRKKHLKTKEERNSSRARRQSKSVKLGPEPQNETQTLKERVPCTTQSQELRPSNICDSQNVKCVELQMRTRIPKTAVSKLDRKTLLQDYASRMASIICLFFKSQPNILRTKCRAYSYHESIMEIREAMKDQLKSGLTSGSASLHTHLPEECSVCFPSHRRPREQKIRRREVPRGKTSNLPPEPRDQSKTVVLMKKDCNSYFLAQPSQSSNLTPAKGMPVPASFLPLGRPRNLLNMRGRLTRKTPISYLLGDTVSEDQPSTRRINSSTCANIASSFEWEKHQDIVQRKGRASARPQEEGPPHSLKNDSYRGRYPFSSSVPLASINNGGITQNLKQEEHTNTDSSWQRQRQRKMDFSLPAVPGSKRTRLEQEKQSKAIGRYGGGRSILPNMMVEMVKPASRRGGLRGSFLQQVRPLSLTCERLKTSGRSLVRHGGSGEGIVIQNTEDCIINFKHKELQSRTWQNILPSLESEEQLVREPTSAIPACSTQPRSIQTGH